MHRRARSLRRRARSRTGRQATAIQPFGVAGKTAGNSSPVPDRMNPPTKIGSRPVLSTKRIATMSPTMTNTVTRPYPSSAAFPGLNRNSDKNRGPEA